MKSDLLQEIKNYVRGYLASNLSPDLTYHNLQHTQEVVNAAEEICLGENLDPVICEDVLIAAWFHDTGYATTYIGHEDESIALARRFLEEKNVSSQRIEHIISLIDATRFMQKPDNKAEACLKDADNLNVGKISFWQRGQNLQTEWEKFLGKTYSPLEWAQMQLSFLQSSRFYTPYCQKNYKPIQDKNIEFVKTKIEEFRQASMKKPLLKRKSILKYARLTYSFILAFILGILVSLSISISIWGFANHAAIIGFIAGIFIGGIIRLFERPYEENIEQKIIFPLALFTRTGLMGVLFLISVGLGALIYALLISERPTAQLYKERFEFVFSNPENIFRFAVLTLLISFILNYVKFTTRIIGRRILIRYLLGRYANPQVEERIFMFVDLNSSTTLAERLGPDKYHLLLTEFFKDISPAIKKTKGEIYQYVGDEVVITWPVKDGIKKNNCVRCFFEMEKNLSSKADEYVTNFGIKPDFKVGLHGGKVITAVVGSLKLDIVYHGDVINTCERILNKCIPLNKVILASEYVIRRLNLATKYQPEFVATLKLKGKESEISLYTLHVLENNMFLFNNKKSFIHTS